MQQTLFKKAYNFSSFEVDHNFQTPTDVCDYMAKMVPQTANTILEPTPGLGNLVRAIKKHLPDHQLTAADDFFLISEKERFDCIIMNPPFSSKSCHMVNAPEGAECHGMKVGYFMLQKAMRLSDNVIALMPWFTLSDSDVRMRSLTAFGIKSLTALPRKTFEYARIQTVIIELHKGWKAETIFRTFNF